MAPSSALECLQIGDDVDDLIPIKPELRHGRMARNDSLGQRPFQAFDRILQVQRAECRRDRKRTVADLVDRMALLAIRAKYRQTALRLRCLLCESALAGSGRTRLRPARLLASGHAPDVLIPLVSLSCSPARQDSSVLRYAIITLFRPFGVLGLQRRKRRGIRAIFPPRWRGGITREIVPASLLACAQAAHSLQIPDDARLDTRDFVGIEIDLMHSLRAKLVTKRSRTPRWRPAGARSFPTPVQPRQDDLVRHALRAHFLPRRPWPAGRYRR